MKVRGYVMDARAEGVEDTRLRILEGARRLFFSQWFDEVTLASLAEAGAVSHQTVLNHFGSKEGVFAALAEMVEAEIEELERQASPRDTKAAMRLLLEQYEQFGLANARLVVQEERVPAVHDLLERARAKHRDWVERTFADCLPAAGAARRQKIGAFLAATEVMAWKALRHDYGLSKQDTFAALMSCVKALEETR